MIEFVPGRRYRVQSEVGEIIGTFVKKEGGKLKFADVVRLVEASHEGEELLATAGIYDAEPWLQSMDFGDTSNTAQAKRAITDVRRRKGVVVKRATKAR